MENSHFTRRLMAIISADAVGYSRLMNDNEEDTIRTLQSYRQVFIKRIRQHNGRLIDSPGDNLLMAFDSVVDALRCALDVQQTLKKNNNGLPENRRMHFRIGINLGDVIEENGRLYGDGVNVAARLESMANPGGINISGTVYDHVKHKFANRMEFLGSQQVKNISQPIRTYRVATGCEPAIAQVDDKPREAALPKLGLVFLLVLITTVTIGWYYWASLNRHPHHRPSRKAAIAVLPFKNLSNAAEQDYFSDGITNDIITDLSKFRELFVISSNTVFQYKGKTVNIMHVGRELGVDYIMEGSVQKAGEEVRINAQLIDSSEGTHVWAERYERKYTDIFELQEEIVQAIVTKLATKTFRYEQARALRKKPHDLLAYDYLLRGNAQYHRRTRSAYAEAKTMFAKALELDPFYAAAYVGLGQIEYGKVAYGWTEFPDVALKRALALGQKAVELDESNATAHSLLSSVYTFQNKHELAIKEAERAIAINPNDSGSYNELGWALLWSGQVNEAVHALERSLRLDTASPRNIWFHLGIAYYLKEDYERASDILEQGLMKRPTFSGYHIALAATYAQLGQTEKASREAAAVRRLDPFFSIQSFGTGFRQPAHRQAIASGLQAAGLE